MNNKIEKYIDTVSHKILEKETSYYWDSGKVRYEYYYNGKKVHRSDGPNRYMV